MAKEFLTDDEIKAVVIAAEHGYVPRFKARVYSRLRSLGLIDDHDCITDAGRDAYAKIKEDD